MKFFKEEQEQLGRILYLSEKLIHKLMNYQFEHNIAELKQCVTMVCANAYAQDSSEESLEIYLYNLPAKLQGSISMKEQDATLVRLDVIQSDPVADKILELWKNLLDNYRYSAGAGESFATFLELGKKTLKYYYDILIFQELFFDERLRPLEKIVVEMIASIRSSYNVNFPVNCAYVIARMMVAQQNHNSRIRGGETLTIELENRYQKEGILTLNKFDESTGQGMEKINFAVSKNGVEEGTVTTDKYGIAQLHIPLQDENKQNRTATETYLLRETNLPTGYVDTGDIQITVEIANGAFKITDAKLVDREANENQEAVKAPVDGKIDGKSVLLQRGDTSLNIRNFAKTGTLHIKKTWENPNDALTEKQVKIRLYQNGISTGQEFLLNEENGWEHTVDNVPLFQDRNPVEYKVEEIEIGKTHYSLEYGDGFLYYEVIYPEIQYFDSNGQQIFPKDENEFKDVSKMELEVQNLHFNLAERSFLKTDDLPRNRLAGAGFLFYKVPYDDVTKKYADDTGYTVDYDNTQSKDDIVLKKDGKTCTTYRSLETDENGMLQLPEDFENGRYWMVESVTPNKKDKADKTKTQYQDNFNLYMVDVESDILFLYEKSPMTNTWRAVSDRHIVNHPQKGGVTVEITKEVTGPLGNRKKPFDMEILYWEDGQKLRSKTIRTSLKHGDKVTLKNVDISSDIIITETVDTSKYAVSISKKEENDKYSNPVQATSNGNTAVMKQRIEAARGDVIELKITNENTQLIPETGVRLRTSRHVWLLFAISIIMILFFRRRRKIR